MIYELKPRNRWVRSNGERIVSGVLSGLARTLNLDVTLVRLVWLVSVLFFGSGILFYIFLAFLLPREDKVEEYEKPKVLGVCHRIGTNYGHEIAAVRVLFAASFILSFGITFLAYFLLFFLLPERPNHRYYGTYRTR